MSAEKQKRFSKPPSLDAILNAEGSQSFIKSGEATPDTKPEKAEVAKKTIAPKKIDDDMPWMTAIPSTKVQHIVRIPDPLKHLLMHLSETVKGENQTSICVRGITQAVEELAKAQGLPLPDNWGSWLK